MMTAATTSRVLSPALSRRDKVSWADLTWLAWRQHRTLIAVTTVGVAIVAGLFWWDAADLSNSSSYPLLSMVILPATAGLMGMFWGGPLLSSEYEQRTHLFVWAQDVSPIRWLTAKLILLGGVAAVLWAIIGLADSRFIHVINSQAYVANQYGPLGSIGFESWIPLQIVYALFAFALGVAAGALVRRTVASMGITMVLFAGVRVLFGTQRLNLLPALPFSAPPDPFMATVPGTNGVVIGDPHLVDAAGHQVSFPNACFGDSAVANLACARAHGVVAAVGYEQPASRVLAFHLIEFGVFAVLTAALITFTVVRLHRKRVLA